MTPYNVAALARMLYERDSDKCFDEPAGAAAS